ENKGRLFRELQFAEERERFLEQRRLRSDVVLSGREPRGPPERIGTRLGRHVGCSLHDGPGQQASGLAHVAVRPPERSQVRNLSEYLRLPSRWPEPTEAGAAGVELP